MYHSKCLKTIAMADFQQICHPHILPKSLIFFLFFARDMTVSPQFWYLSNCTRRKAPLLRDLPADARAEH